MGIKRKPTAACRAIARAPLSPLPLPVCIAVFICTHADTRTLHPSGHIMHAMAPEQDSCDRLRVFVHVAHWFFPWAFFLWFDHMARTLYKLQGIPRSLLVGFARAIRLIWAKETWSAAVSNRRILSLGPRECQRTFLLCTGEALFLSRKTFAFAFAFELNLFIFPSLDEYRWNGLTRFFICFGFLEVLLKSIF